MTVDMKRSISSRCFEHEVLCLWILALIVFMFGIWKQPFVNFETRFAVFAQEMLRHGPSLFPTTYGQPYPDYPVTSTILIWLFSLPFGQITKFSAVLPTALASASIIAVTYQLFAQYSKRWGILAVCLEFLTMTFLAESRSISVDQMLSAITLYAFYITNKSYLSDLALPTKRLLLLLVAGFLIRGPIGIVLPAGVVLSHLLWTSERRVIIRFAARSAVVLIACSGILLGLATIYYGQAFAIDIIKMQAVGRFAEPLPSSKFYYFTNSLGNYALSYPIAVMVAFGTLLGRFKLNTTVSKGHVSIVILLLAWIAIVFVGLSIPETKKARYILPAVPALAGLASYVFINTELPFLKWVRRCVELVLLSLPLVATVFLFLKREALRECGLDPGLSISIFALLFLANISLLFLFKNRANDHSPKFVFVAVLAAFYFNLAIIEPIDLHLHDTRPFVRHIESLRAQQPGTLWFYKENPDGLPIKYLANADTDLHPQFSTDLDALKRRQSPVWLLTKEKNIDELKTLGIGPESQIYRQRFGDIPFVAIFLPDHSSVPPAPNRSVP